VSSYSDESQEGTKEIQKHALRLKEPIYFFEESEESITSNKSSTENMKSVKFVLPLKISLFSPFKDLPPT
jgi:hypothetical protein